MKTIDPTPSPSRNDRWIYLIGSILLGIGLVLRFYRLGSLPGINGDEAWLGVAVEDGMRSIDIRYRTPTGNFIDPFFFFTEWALLRLFDPRSILLRLPAALWNVAGLGVFFALYRRMLGGRCEAFLATVVLACLPLHLANSRMGWDPSFIFLVAPPILFSAMAICERGWNTRRVALLVGVSFLALWVHMMMIVFLGLIGAGFWCVRVRCALASERGERKRLLIRIFAGSALCLVVMAIFGVIITRFTTVPIGILIEALSRSIRQTATIPEVLISNMQSIGSIFSGERAYEYFAGKPMIGLSSAIDWLFLAIAIGCFLFLLVRSPRRSDWCLGFLGLAIVPAILLLSGVLRPRVPGCERYVLWIAPVFAIALVRTLSIIGERLDRKRLARTIPIVLLLFSTINLAQIGRYYFVAIARHEYHEAQLPTFRTGPEEPKAAAARLIRQIAERERVEHVLADDWWICQPLRFLLPNDCTLHDMSKESFVPKPKEGVCIAVAWPGSEFSDAIARFYNVKDCRIERVTIPDANNAPLLIVTIARNANP
jgi:hypothetical protein